MTVVYAQVDPAQAPLLLSRPRPPPSHRPPPPPPPLLAQVNCCDDWAWNKCMLGAQATAPRVAAVEPTIGQRNAVLGPPAAGPALRVRGSMRCRVDRTLCYPPWLGFTSDAIGAAVWSCCMTGLALDRQTTCHH